MSTQITPVLMCGGSGGRLWPVSRKSFPKQFTPLVADESTFQQTARRVSAPIFELPIVLTGDDFRFIVSEQLENVGIKNCDILIEPAPRNTAAAICAAALTLESRSPESLMLVCPADHSIPDVEKFYEAVEAALPEASNHKIVTFGVLPSRAETGYGWLELNSKGAFHNSDHPQELKSFVEKPKKEFAEELLESGRHLWNSGIFMFSTTTILDAFSKHAPEILELVRAAVEKTEKDLSFTRLSKDAWDSIPDISIDYAIMEQVDNLVVIPFRGSWTDLGDWQSIWREKGPDEDGVVVSENSTAIDCENTYLEVSGDSLQLVGIGLKNIVAVAMSDAVLVADISRTQDVKNAVQTLKEKGVSQAEILPRDYRPWGWYESLAVGSRFQVKRIVVLPGASLSLQSHYHRAEHWVVVKGTAKVTVGDSVSLLTENESIYIPLGSLHRLENPGRVTLTLIEIQTGAYLEEDDIVRYDDIYSRGQGAKG